MLSEEFSTLTLKKDFKKTRLVDEVKCKDNRVEEPMYFVIKDLNFNDLYDFSKSETKSEGNLIKKVSAFARKSSNGKLVEVNKKSIAIFRFGSEVFAIDEKCPHVGGPLHLGDIETIGEGNILCVVCPWHRWKIELATGKIKQPQITKQTQVYPIKISADGTLSIGFDEFSPDYFKCEEDF